MCGECGDSGFFGQQIKRCAVLIALQYFLQKRGGPKVFAKKPLYLRPEEQVIDAGGVYAKRLKRFE